MFLQAITDSTDYKLGYSIGSWLPFAGLAILLTIMILMIRRRRS